jgi:hypothetical protein
MATGSEVSYGSSHPGLLGAGIGGSCDVGVPFFTLVFKLDLVFGEEVVISKLDRLPLVLVSTGAWKSGSNPAHNCCMSRGS